jgi:hypothetical protein
VVAVVEPRADRAPTLDAVQRTARSKIAGYKVPRELHLVAKVERSPSRQPDYRWAKGKSRSPGAEFLPPGEAPTLVDGP